MRNSVLGVDIGGVIIDKVNDGTDTSFFSDNYLHTTAVSGAFEALREITRSLSGKVYLVSKCGRKTEAKTLEWLGHHRFFEQTGISRNRIRFCRKRHEKAPICADLGITHFVDDRLEVLSYLTTVSTRFLFRPDQSEVRRFVDILPQVTQVRSWEEIRNVFLR